MSRARPSSCTARCSSTAAGTGSGTAAWPGTPLASDTVIALRNTAGDGERTLLVVTNLGADPVALPAGEVLVVSGPLTDEGAVPTDTTVWVRLPVA